MKDYRESLYNQINDITECNATEADLCGVEIKHWVDYAGKKFLFKQDDRDGYGFCELLLSRVGYLFGFNVVNTYPAIDDEKKGVIVESYLTDDVVQVLSLSDLINAYYEPVFGERNYNDGIEYSDCYFSVHDLETMIPSIEWNGIKADRNLIKDFKKMVLVDYLFAQIDRHDGNVEFLIVENENGEQFLKLAPMYDNGRMLGRGSCYAYSQGEELAKEFSPDIAMTYEYRNDDETEAEAIGRNIARAISKDEELRIFYERLRDMNFGELLDDVALTCEYDVDYWNCKFMTDIFNTRIDIVDQTLYLIDEAKKNKQQQNNINEKDEGRDIW